MMLEMCFPIHLAKVLYLTYNACYNNGENNLRMALRR